MAQVFVLKDPPGTHNEKLYRTPLGGPMLPRYNSTVRILYSSEWCSGICTSGTLRQSAPDKATAHLLYRKDSGFFF